MDIAVIGTGSVGGTLGRRWAHGGHRVIYGSRDPGARKVQQLVEESGEGALATDPAGAAARAPVLLLATPWTVTENVLRSLGDLTGKVIIDAVNPLEADLSGLAVGHSISAAELVASWASGARIVKAFNTTGSANMADPEYGDQRASMFLCGEDAEAKGIVAELTNELGFDVVDAGGLQAARYLEPLAMLWIHLALVRGMGGGIAFRLLQR